MTDRDINSTADFSASPQPTPGHECNLPDPDDYRYHRWYCPVCDAQWWHMNKMIARRVVHEWRLLSHSSTLDHPRSDSAMVSELAARELWQALGGEPHYSPTYSELLERARSVTATYAYGQEDEI